MVFSKQVSILSHDCGRSSLEFSCFIGVRTIERSEIESERLENVRRLLQSEVTLKARLVLGGNAKTTHLNPVLTCILMFANGEDIYVLT